MTECCCKHTAEDGCATIPEFERPTYHFGQMLGPMEFQSQHRYLADKLELLARFGIGHGIACGLETRIEEGNDRDCDPKLPPFHRWRLIVEPGIAINCEGKLVVLRRRLECLLTDLIPEESHDKLCEPFWVTLCPVESPTCPSRPMPMLGCDPCEPTPMARIRDEVRVAVLFDKPPDPCDECCGHCASTCVALGEFETENAETLPTLDRQIRRPLGQRLTTVDAVNWVHGGRYTLVSGSLPLLSAGLRIRFSRPVHIAHVIEPGVVDIVVNQGGTIPAGTPYQPIVNVAAPNAKPGDDFATEFEISYQADPPRGGDRVLVTLRCDFILDNCCQAVDGNHIGGAVKFDESMCEEGDHPTPPARPGCERSPRPLGSLGNGNEGGTFESWIFIEENVK